MALSGGFSKKDVIKNIEKYFGKMPKGVKGEKVKVKEIVKLIIEWLKIIPGASRYFLEQEAKIKTDKILKLKKPHTK